MCWYIGRKHELLLDTTREIASELNIEKTKYRLIACLVKRMQDNSEYTYVEGQQILIQINSRTDVLLARHYVTSRTVPITAITIARHWGTLTEHSRQKWRYLSSFHVSCVQDIINSVYLLWYSKLSCHLISIFRLVRKIAKSDYQLPRISDCPTSWNVSDFTWRMFMKYDFIIMIIMNPQSHRASGWTTP
jgi:hypothetical protein